jgi:CheY-like chemotaxis protein
MRDASEFSIFGKGTAKDNEAAPKVEAKAKAEAEKQAVEPQKPMTPELVTVEHLTMEQLEALFPSENTETNAPAAAAPPATPVPAATAPATKAIATEAPTAVAPTPRSERRAKRRALISAPVRVRSIDSTRNALDEVSTTLNVSRLGILLASKDTAYYRSMDVMVTFPHSNAPQALQAEQPGRVVRVSEMPDGRRSIAIALGVVHHVDEEFILANGETVSTDPHAPKIKVDRDPNSPKPLVLALDAEASVRDSLKSYLANEGYEVIAVTNAREAREVLDQCTPSLLIAEIEGEGMPGYDICAHCKTTPRLQSVPVMLTTSSAYPSDYANAHSLGAVVCMAKPYRQERLGHVVKLLAPPPNANDNVEPPHPIDPARRHMTNSKSVTPNPASAIRRFRFGKKN